MAVIAITLGSFLGNVPTRTLPFKGWLPFDPTSDIGFWIAFLHQNLAHAMAATIGSIHDTLFHGLMAQACGQLNLLKSRLRSMPQRINDKNSESNEFDKNEDMEKKELEKSIRHHHEIFRCVNR